VAALTADVPALRADVLDHALAAAAAVGSALVVDASGTGTTLLSAAPEVTLDPQFGPDSAGRHQRAGAVPLTGPGLGPLRQDVDTEADLIAACRLGLGPATLRYVRDARLWLTRSPLGAGFRPGCESRGGGLVALR
jgi:2-phospho-L-lactate guanylyltransferase